MRVLALITLAISVFGTGCAQTDFLHNCPAGSTASTSAVVTAEVHNGRKVERKEVRRNCRF